MPISADKITSYLGLILGALHQVGVVGTLPQTKADWYNTLASVGMVLLGYFTNKS